MSNSIRKKKHRWSLTLMVHRSITLASYFMLRIKYFQIINVIWKFWTRNSVGNYNLQEIFIFQTFYMIYMIKLWYNWWMYCERRNCFFQIPRCYVIMKTSAQKEKVTSDQCSITHLIKNQHWKWILNSCFCKNTFWYACRDACWSRDQQIRWPCQCSTLHKER